MPGEEIQRIAGGLVRERRALVGEFRSVKLKCGRRDVEGMAAGVGGNAGRRRGSVARHRRLEVAVAADAEPELLAAAVDPAAGGQTAGREFDETEVADDARRGLGDNLRVDVLRSGRLEVFELDIAGRQRPRRLRGGCAAENRGGDHQPAESTLEELLVSRSYHSLLLLRVWEYSTTIRPKSIPP